MSEQELVLDPGHGGTDSGAVGNGLKEKELTLDLAKRTKKYIEDNYSGVNVHMTRTTDKTLSLKERTDFANNKKADLTVSIHINAGGGTGYEDFIYNGGVGASTKKAQDLIHAAVMKEIKDYKVKDRGQKTANFHMVREPKGPAILTENLFIDDKDDAALLKKSAFKDDIATGHGKAIASFLGLKAKKKTEEPKKETATSSKKGLKRVIVGGKQVGAYGNDKNVLEQVEKALKTDKTILIEEV